MKSFAGFVLSILFVFTAASHATQIVYQTPRQMGATSTIVVEGEVSAVRSYWNSDHTKILTETQITVSASHKGQASGVVRVLQLGGEVGHVRANVAGALSWRTGEEVLLFLEAMPGGAHRVAGFSQGKYRVERDDAGRRFVVAPSLDGVELVGAPDGSPPPARLERVEVGAFVNDALGKGGAR